MEFPTKERIAQAHAESGIGPDEVCCGRCGAPITTGAMALICPYERECEFWCPEVDTFTAALNAETLPAAGGEKHE